MEELLPYANITTEGNIQLGNITANTSMGNNALGEVGQMLMQDVCQSCPKLLNLVNACPMVVGVRTSRLSELHAAGYSSKILDSLLVGASVLNCLALAAVWINLYRKKTTRSFCMALCQLISLIAVNHINHAFEEPRPQGACSTADFGMPSLSATLCASLVMWLLLESFHLPPNILFKQSLMYVVTRTFYLSLSPFVLVSRFYLRYSTPTQVFYGYSIGSLIATGVFIFIKTTTLASQNIKGGLFPLWARLGLVNNMSVDYLGQSSKQDYLQVIKLRKQAEPIHNACDQMEAKYHMLNIATAPLLNANKKNGLINSLLKNKDMASEYMTPEFEAELEAKIEEAIRTRAMPEKSFTTNGQFTDPDLSNLSKSVYDFMQSN
jgi:membrane-associated phospholipid phosphatase